MEWFLMAVGAMIGLASAVNKNAEAKKQAREQKEFLEKMYVLNVAHAEEDFAAAKETAERNAKQAEQQADLADKSLDITEQSLSQDFNTAIDNLYLSQESDAYNWNTAAMQMGSVEGSAYSNLAASGVRAGSSLSDAVLMESAVNENQLQFSQDAKRRSDDANLSSVLENLAGNRFNIQQGRIGADVTRDDAAWLRNSYLEGGHNYNLYQNQLAQLKETTDYNVTQANYQIEKSSGWNAFLSNMTGMFQGATSGYSLYGKLSNAWDKLKPYTRTNTTNTWEG